MSAAVAWHGVRARAWWRRINLKWMDLALIVAVGLAARLALWPFATTDTGDATTRVWLAWRWLDDTSVIGGLAWAPLHFYLMAPVLWLTGDPVWAPIALHIVIAAATAPLVYGFCLQEFGDRRASLAAALVFALYPVAIRNSLMAISEAPFIFFLALCLLLLARARGPGGARHHAALAGLALTLAGMLRYEAWMLTPFLAVLLWPRRDLLLWFVAGALLYPIFQMTSHTWQYGDPLRSFHASARWELEMMGRGESLTLADRARTVLVLGWLTFKGITPLVALLAACGAALAVLRRSPAAGWLLPCVGLFALMAASAVRGALVPRLFYTVTFGLFMIPYLALLLNALQIGRWRRRGCIAAVTLLASATLALSLPWVAQALPLAKVISGSSPLPAFPEQEAARPLPGLIRSQLRDAGDGLVSDFYGWQPTFYVALRTRLHPDRIFVAPGAPNRALDPSALEDFLERYPRGVLLLHLGSRFRAALAFDGARAVVGNRVMVLTKVEDVPWPALDGTLGAPAQDDLEPGLAIFRYRSERGALHGSSAWSATSDQAAVGPGVADRGHADVAAFRELRR